jgi:NH3-dependent NAD+ synthetase
VTTPARPRPGNSDLSEAPPSANGDPLFDLPPELAIDTDVARRVIGQFIRGQLRQAGFDRAVVGLSGGIDSALVAYLVAEAIGADKLLCVLMPYRTSSPASRVDAEEVVQRLVTVSEVVVPAARQLHGPPAHGRPVRPLGHVGRSRGGDRQQDRIADRLHHGVR